MSVMARCAATPRICDSANEVTAWTTRGGARGQRDRQQQIGAALADHLVDEPLRRGRQHEPRQAADEHQRQAERQPAAMGPDQLARLAPRGRGATRSSSVEASIDGR